MSDQVPLDINRLSFDSFGRNPARDVVCLTPIRTIVRREEEIILVRKVRKVEEIDAGLSCPTNTTPVSDNPEVVTPVPVPTPAPELYELPVYANARVDLVHDYQINGCKDLNRNEFIRILGSKNLLSAIANEQGQPITVKIESIDGSWTYGEQDSTNQFDLQVGADGNTRMTEREADEGDMLFTDLGPATLVAFKITNYDTGEYVYVGHGSQLMQTTFTLQPGEKLYFISNDEPGFYYDNKDLLTLKWRIV